MTQQVIKDLIKQATGEELTDFDVTFNRWGLDVTVKPSGNKFYFRFGNSTIVVIDGNNEDVTTKFAYAIGDELYEALYPTIRRTVVEFLKLLRDKVFSLLK